MRYRARQDINFSSDSKRKEHWDWRTSASLERVVLKLRKSKPTWGPKKLKIKLEELHPGLKIPAASTIGDILKSNGCITYAKEF
jgi:hypothetical protein